MSDRVTAGVVLGRIRNRHVLFGDVDVGLFLLGLGGGDPAWNAVVVFFAVDGGHFWLWSLLYLVI